MSYNALADAQTAIGAGLTQAQLDSATLYLDARYSPWPGILASTAQAENWPRTQSDGTTLVDANGRELTGIPEQVKAAEVEAARLIFQGQSLLPVTVASASSASTQNRDVIEETVASDGERVTTRWSPSGTTSSTNTVQTLDDNGLPIVALIDALLKPITDVVSTQSGSNYLFLRA